MTDVVAESGLDSVKAVRAIGGKADFIQSDVTNAGDVKNVINRVFNKYGKLDVLVNSAGTSFVRPLSELTEKEWNETIDVNLKGTFLFCKHAAVFIKQGGGEWYYQYLFGSRRSRRRMLVCLLCIKGWDSGLN